MNSGSAASKAPLERGLGLPQAIALNISNMVGIGPFITIPAFLAAMGGPQALIGWIIAAILVICDGLVWSELGAALPGSGGSYHFLKQTFGRYRWGRILPFLFIWQFLISGTLELASGYIGAADYLRYVFPTLDQSLANFGVPQGYGANILLAAASLVVVWVLCRRITIIGRLSLILFSGTALTVLIVIVAGLTHFRPELLTFPPNAFRLDGNFAMGLGAAMLIAIYDYLGYYNICHLGDETRDPARTIPRAVMISVVLIACIYLVMNLSIIAVVPWEEAIQSKNIAATFMERLFGVTIAKAFTWLIIWTALACVFAMTLGYSRIPYAAARGGDFFSIFGKLHPTHGYPVVSLVTIGLLTAAFCFLSLDTVIKAAVTVRILTQFVGQIAALHILRTQRPDIIMPFRMKLYPLPSLIALVGWVFVLASSGWVPLLAGLGVTVTGCLAFLGWTYWTSGKPGFNTSEKDLCNEIS